MTVFNSGPINIEQGNTADFTVEFLDSSGSLTVPSSGTLTMVYVNTSNVVQTDAVPLTVSNSFFTGSWSSTSAALGLATWNATMAGSTVSQAAGQIRVLQRQSSY
jgi:hypothetical protein